MQNHQRSGVIGDKNRVFRVLALTINTAVRNLIAFFRCISERATKAVYLRTMTINFVVIKNTVKNILYRVNFFFCRKNYIKRGNSSVGGCSFFDDESAI